MTDIADAVDLRSFTIAVLVIGIAAYLFAVRRIAAPGPLVKGQAHWRYRSRAVRERIGRARTWLVLPDRTSGWWTTRLEFAAAVVTILFAIRLITSAPILFDDQPPERLLLLNGAAIAAMLFGLAWMIRIYRAPLRHDAKAYWRYHDGP